MSITILPIVTGEDNYTQYDVTNLVPYANNSATTRLNDGAFYRYDAGVLKFADDVFTNPTSPTWVSGPAIADVSDTTVTRIQELYDGEALIYASTTTASVNTCRVFRTTGWNSGAGKLTASLTLVLTTIGGAILPEYCGHEFAHAADGTVVVGEGGSQTTSGDTGPTATKAIRAWISKDFGLTWNVLFNLLDYAAIQGFPAAVGVHLHGLSYDQDWGRVWLHYGDNTGDGKNIAGLGNTQTVYSDDDGATWTKLPMPPYWTVFSPLASDKVMQFINTMFNADAIIMTPDVSKPLATFIYPKTGYRTMGNPFNGPLIPTAVRGVPMRQPLNAARTAYGPYSIGGVRSVTSTTGDQTFTVSASSDLKNWSNIRVTVPVTAQTALGFTEMIGPDPATGKVMLKSAATIDGGYRFYIGDLVRAN